MPRTKKWQIPKKKELKTQGEAYFEKLNLTEVQKASYMEIVQKYGDLLKLIGDSSLAYADKLKEIQHIQSDMDEEVKNLLSEEQYSIYKEHEQQKRQKLLEAHGGEFASHLERLDLSEEQKSKYITITKHYKTQLEQLKTSSKPKFSKYRSYTAIKGQKDAEVKGLLSPEQYGVYIEIQQQLIEKRNL